MKISALLVPFAGLQAYALSVTIYTNADFNNGVNAGSSQTFSGSTISCTNLDSFMNDKISSIKIGAGTSCKFFQNSGCGGAATGVWKTGSISNLQSKGFPGGGNWNDRISSLNCWKS